MVFIVKHNQPGELLRYRKQLKEAAEGEGEGHSNPYDLLPSSIKDSIRQSLVKEQGGLCAYCMARIGKRTGDTTIEHWAPQRPANGKSGHDPLDYKNMLGVCAGNRGSGSEKGLTCDAKKGNDSITVNPLKKETLADIYYTSKGEIHSWNSTIDNDLDVILNLNSELASMPQRRQRALEQLFSYINKKYANRTANRAAFQKTLSQLESETEQKTPYVGILIYWLNKKLEQSK